MRTFSIITPKGERKIGIGEPCFIVAEMSANHRQEYATAVEIVKAAARAGADAIKLQSYLPDSLSIDSKKKWFQVGGEKNPESWQSKTFYDLYKEAFTPREWHPKLQRLAEDLGLVFFSSPYCADDVTYLETLNVPLYKVASYEATDIPFLRAVASTGKPVIMSVGFATLDEITLSVETLKSARVKNLVLLHCVTSYTDKTPTESSNLRTMYDMSERFNVPVGFSDNNGGNVVPILAAAMGAVVIEKHITLKGLDTFDARFSSAEEEFKAMVDQIRANEKIMGTIHYGPQTQAEEYNRRFRRSLFVVKDIKQGEKFTSENIRSIRPADGIETKYYDEVLGKRANQNIERGTPLQWDLIV